MSFNKIKAMKNAERFLTQGKIQAAISEYQQVVENEPKDINSRNMLGDLYVKADDKQAAVNCYQEVAEHYNSQGFAKKAIAIYNKIYRIEPDSLEISMKLAELYRVRGSMAEAKKHYEELAKRYELKGHKLEALEIWEKIAEISPSDTEIYIKIADVYWQEQRKSEAAKAFYEAGVRFAENEKHEAAVTSFSRSLEVNPDDLQAIRGIVKSQIALGYPEDAAAIIEQALENEPHHKEFNYLLMDCYFDMGSPEKAEVLIISLVEREPASYLKLLDLVNVYLEHDNLDSAVRILSMTSEHLLVGGESELLLEALNEVLARNPEHIAALRILARFHGWNRDEDELRQTLELLAESAHLNDQIEDEKYALSQYLLLVPHDVDRVNRLREINQTLGLRGDENEERLLDSNSGEVPTFESFATLSDSNESSSESGVESDQEQEILVAEEINEDVIHQVESSEVEIVEETDGVELNEDAVVDSFDSIHKTNSDDTNDEHNSDHTKKVDEESIKDDFSGEAFDNTKLSPTDELRIDEETDSIKFYIEQGYIGLAEKSLAELENEFGNRAEIAELRSQLPKTETEEKETVESETVEADSEVNESKFDEVSNLDESIEDSDYSEIENDKNLEEELVEEDNSETVQTGEEFVNESTEEIHESIEEEEEVTEKEQADAVEDCTEEDEQQPIAEDVENQESTESITEEKADEVQTSTDTIENFEIEESDELIEEERIYTNSFESLKDELGLDDEENNSEENEFEEHYQHAVVYQEMGMLEEAIREYQDAVKLVAADDGTSRFMNCCTMIGHCFIEKGMPRLSVPWFEKGFEKTNLSMQEKLGLHYEIANAYEVSGDREKALKQFEMIYSSDVDYRDVGERLQSLNDEMLTPA